MDINIDLSISSGIDVLQLNIMDFKNNSLKPSFQITNSSKDSFESAINDINSIIVEKLISFITKRHNEGVTFDNIKQLIERQILRFNQPSNDIINWLLKNQVKPQYIHFLGLFYYYNVGVDENSIKAFELFLKASKSNYSLAHVYLAKCYSDGYGTKKDYILAFNWYKKSVENGSNIGQFYLGCCYEFSIGTLINEKKSVELYQKAANDGNTTAAIS